MSIRIYNVMGLGLLVGEKKSQDNENIYLKNPGLIIPNQQTKDGLQHLMVPPVPDFFESKVQLLKNFPLKKIQVLFSGTPSQEIFSLYERYNDNLLEAITGIKRAGPGALNNLPKDGRGGPLIQ